MITLNKFQHPEHPGFLVSRDGTTIGTVERHDKRYWRVVRDRKVLVQRIRTAKSAIDELLRIDEQRDSRMSPDDLANHLAAMLYREERLRSGQFKPHEFMQLCRDLIKRELEKMNL